MRLFSTKYDTRWYILNTAIVVYIYLKSKHWQLSVLIDNATVEARSARLNVKFHVIHACPAGCFAFCVDSFFCLFKINFWAKRSHDLLDRFSAKFHHVVGIWPYIADLTPVFRRFKGRCHDNQFYGQDLQNRTIHLHS